MNIDFKSFYAKLVVLRDTYLRAIVYWCAVIAFFTTAAVLKDIVNGSGPGTIQMMVILGSITVGIVATILTAGRGLYLKPTWELMGFLSFPALLVTLTSLYASFKSFSTLLGPIHANPWDGGTLVMGTETNYAIGASLVLFLLTCLLWRSIGSSPHPSVRTA